MGAANEKDGLFMNKPPVRNLNLIKQYFSFLSMLLYWIMDYILALFKIGGDSTKMTVNILTHSVLHEIKCNAGRIHIKT